MPKAGEVHVHMTKRTAGAAALWLGNYISFVEATQKESWVSTAEERAIDQRRLDRLRSTLAKAATRKRTSVLFSLNIERELVERFVSVVECSSLGDPWVRRALAQFKAAQCSHRGRPRLEGNDLARRVGALALDERHRKRLSRQLKWDVAWDRWLTEISAVGETLLTASTPPPKF